MPAVERSRYRVRDRGRRRGDDLIKTTLADHRTRGGAGASGVSRFAAHHTEAGNNTASEEKKKESCPQGWWVGTVAQWV